MTVPQFSVIVPAHDGAAVLPQSLGALAASDWPRESWELIVVDDASRDGTGTLAARWADRVITVPDGPRGPAYARNRGAEHCRAEWIVFIDADVVVHRDTLRRFAEARQAEPATDAFFGAYDANPPAPGFLSRYRNLLHRYVHLTNAGPAETFWAGCGAVRRSTFLGVGGFDERRFRRPQIEDIELGYRLHDRGSRISIRPEIEAAHLKRWTLSGMVRTDLFDRAIPWVRLLLQRRRIASSGHLNVKPGERVRVLLTCLGLVLLVLGGLLWSLPLLLAGAGAWVATALSNIPLLAWFARQRGLAFALGVIPLNLWYYLTNGVAVLAGGLLHLFDRGAGPVTPSSFQSGLRPQPGLDSSPEEPIP